MYFQTYYDGVLLIVDDITRWIATRLELKPTPGDNKFSSMDVPFRGEKDRQCAYSG